MKPFIVIGVFICLSIWEIVSPFYYSSDDTVFRKFKNLLLAVIALLISRFVFLLVVSPVFVLIEQERYGLFYLMSVPEVVKYIILFLLFDLWMYWWHRLNHEVKFLWRFHKVHHSDIFLDITTGFRFHPIELFLSWGCRIIVLLLLGMHYEVLVIYEMLSIVLVLFHHSNVYMSGLWDDRIRMVWVTPNMHRVHHSVIWSETNSNYASFLSIWDRIFRSHVVRGDVEQIKIGLQFLRESKWQSLWGMLRTPFMK